MQATVTAVAVGNVRKMRARLDLREVYPPKRDSFHRDLERLNKLRGAAPTTQLPRQLQDRKNRLRERYWYGRHTIAGPTYGAIVLWFRAVCAYLLQIFSVVLVVAAVAGAGYMLGLGIGSLI